MSSSGLSVLDEVLRHTDSCESYAVLDSIVSHIEMCNASSVIFEDLSNSDSESSESVVMTGEEIAKFLEVCSYRDLRNGTFECSICFDICNVVTKVGVYKVCAKCKKCILYGDYFSSKKERRYIDYLKTNFVYPMIKRDARVKGNVCLNYRPDAMYCSPGLVIYVEIDEFEHYGGGYSCDEKRMSELFDETGGIPVIFVRVNPDLYDCFPSAPESERKLLLLRVLNSIVSNYDKIECPLQVLYLYYSKTNPIISKSIPNVLICNISDFKLH